MTSLKVVTIKDKCIDEIARLILKITLKIKYSIFIFSQQKKNPQNLKLERITNQKIQKLSKMHIYIVKYRRLNTWDTQAPMGTKELKKY